MGKWKVAKIVRNLASNKGSTAIASALSLYKGDRDTHIYQTYISYHTHTTHTTCSLNTKHTQMYHIPHTTHHILHAISHTTHTTYQAYMHASHTMPCNMPSTHFNMHQTHIPSYRRHYNWMPHTYPMYTRHILYATLHIHHAWTCQTHIHTLHINMQTPVPCKLHTQMYYITYHTPRSMLNDIPYTHHTHHNIVNTHITYLCHRPHRH